MMALLNWKIGEAWSATVRGKRSISGSSPTQTSESLPAQHEASCVKKEVPGSVPAPGPTGRLSPSKIVPDDFVLGPSWASSLRGRLSPSKIVPDDFVLGPSWASSLRGRLSPSKIVPDDFVMRPA